VDADPGFVFVEPDRSVRPDLVAHLQCVRAAEQGYYESEWRL
jgi:hypothetical protein